MFIDSNMPWTWSGISQHDCHIRFFFKFCYYHGWRRHRILRMVLTQWSWIGMTLDHYHLRNNKLQHILYDPQSHPTWHYQKFNKSKSIWVAKVCLCYSNIIRKIHSPNKIRWRRTRRLKKNEFVFNHVKGIFHDVAYEKSIVNRKNH